MTDCDWIMQPKKLHEVPALEAVAEDPADAASYLGVVGLADPMLMARKPSELSTGQRARLRLAIALAHPGEVIVADDWLQDLDQLTARAVAWSAQRACRSLGVGLLVATVRDDLVYDLQADWRIDVGWQPEPLVRASTPSRTPCSVQVETHIEPADHEDWRQLSQLHYCGGDPAFVAERYRAVHEPTGSLLGVIVLVHPEAMIGARHEAFADSIQQWGLKNFSRYARRTTRRVARVVVSPEARGIGIGRMLLEHAAKESGVHRLEILTQQSRIGPWLTRCGWREWPHPADPAADMLAKCLERHLCPAHARLDGGQLAEWCDGLSKRARYEVRAAVWAVYHHFVIYRRTKKRRPARVPNPGDGRWSEAWTVAASRSQGRPRYWLSPPCHPEAVETST